MNTAYGLRPTTYALPTHSYTASMAPLFDTSPVDAPVAYARVALEQGIDLAPDGLTYGIPEALRGLVVGERVTVPLGRGDKHVSGYIVSISETCDLPPAKLAKVKVIHARDASGVSLTSDLMQLARWMASYYCCPLGMVFSTMLPAAVKHGTGTVQRMMVGLRERHEGTEAPRHEGEGDDNRPKLTKLQQAVMDAANTQREAGEAFTEIRELADLAGAKSISPVKQLIEKGLLITQTQAAIRATPSVFDPPASAAPLELPVLTPAQDLALTHIAEHIGKGFSVNLLLGVTGSGKTEVYLRAIENMNSNGAKAHALLCVGAGDQRSAIVLVPEIALTPQTAARFQQRFGTDVAVLHSGLTAAQRHEQWRRIRAGGVRIVVGARSAIFAPMENVGLIIVDEEHENSYKQDQLPRYHARDVAIKRGQLLNIPVILGSATPSLESYYNAGGGEAETSAVRGETSGTASGHRPTANARPSRFHLLRLPQRVPGLTLPKVEIVDLSEERRKRYQASGKAGVHLLSLRLEQAIQQTLDHKAQTLLLLNRRGYANYIACPDQHCGWLMQCDHCDTTMVFHKDAALPTGGYVHCHHCTAKQLLPKICPKCNAHKITVFGLGVQRVEEELARKFPGARILRMDSDSMRTSRDYHDSLERFRAGQIDILAGTQMIAKGLDFPNVRLVGVISADTSLHLPDFRSSERTFQLIAQVAGRTGRGRDPGTVVVQTFNPHDPAIVLASAHNYDGFAARELDIRKSMGLPPVTRMARIVVRDKDHVKCYEQARALATQLTQANDELKLGVRLRGPAPCPLARVADYFRMQIEIIGADAATIQKLLTALRNARLLKSDNHTAVDVDPVDLL